MRFILGAIILASIITTVAQARYTRPTTSWGYEEGYNRGNHCSKGFFFSRSFCWLRIY